MTRLHICVADNAIHRDGHKPFSRTIGDALSQLASRSTEDAFKRDELEQLRKGRKRNYRGAK